MEGRRFADRSRGLNTLATRGLVQSMLGLDEQTLERRSLARNEALFRQGEKVTAIYYVEAGRLRLERRTFDGRTLVLGTDAVRELLC